MNYQRRQSVKFTYLNGKDPNKLVSKTYSDIIDHDCLPSIKVFATKEEAILHAALLGFQQPQVFDDFKLPDYAKRLLSFIEGSGGSYVFPAEVYRLMVLDGVMQPIEKFMKKKVA